MKSRTTHSLTVTTHLKRTKFILLIHVLLSIFSNAQNQLHSELNHSEVSRFYSLQINNYQVLELVEFTNGQYFGKLNHSINKINLKYEFIKAITERIIISDSIVSLLMAKLKVHEIESITDCKDLKDCLIGLDGTTITIGIINNNNDINRKYFYWEPESDYYYKGQIIPEVKKIREILNTINNEINLWESFKKFRDKLPKGRYSYGMVIMDVK